MNDIFEPEAALDTCLALSGNGWVVFGADLSVIQARGEGLPESLKKHPSSFERFLLGVHPEDRESVERGLHALLAGEAKSDLEFRLTGFADGNEKIVCLSARKHESDGESRIFGVLQDVTRWRQKEKSLARDFEKAKESDQAKARFVADVSHEMRTPLGIIAGFTELALDPSQTPAEKEAYLQSIRSATRQLRRLVDELLDLSKIDAGKLEIEETEVSLEDFLTETATLAEANHEKKEVTFRVRKEGPVPSRIRTDPHRVRQVLFNLISNSFKFTERGEIELIVSMEANDGPLKFIVNDTGIGIPTEQKPRLFRAFCQGDDSISRRFGGTGLGLLLSKKIARALGGDLSLAWSEAGRGSSFVFSLPAGKIASAGTEPRESMSENDATDPVDLHGLKVLLAEDAPDMRFLVRRFLEEAGASVDSVDNGADAVNRTENGDYDLVLMDIQMPVMDGYDAVERLREHGYRRPVIALSGYGTREEQERCLRSGFDRHLVKPVDRRGLLNDIGRTLRSVGTNWIRRV